MKLVAAVALFRSLLPAIYVVADAFRYGMAKNGDGTWKSVSAQAHASIALDKLVEWFTTRRFSLLADSVLRLLFALCLTAKSSKYIPKQPAVEPEIKASENADLTNG